MAIVAKVEIEGVVVRFIENFSGSEIEAVVTIGGRQPHTVEVTNRESISVPCAVISNIGN